MLIPTTPRLSYDAAITKLDKIKSCKKEKDKERREAEDELQRCRLRLWARPFTLPSSYAHAETARRLLRMYALGFRLSKKTRSRSYAN